MFVAKASCEYSTKVITALYNVKLSTVEKISVIKEENPHKTSFQNSSTNPQAVALKKFDSPTFMFSFACADNFWIYKCLVSSHIIVRLCSL